MKALCILALAAILAFSRGEASPRRHSTPISASITLSPDTFPEGLPVAPHEKVQHLDFPNETYRNVFQTLSTFYDVRITFPRKLAESRCSIQISDADLLQILERALAPQNYKAKLRGKRHIIIKKSEPNKALEPTTMPVTFRADARTAPGMVAAQF